MSNKKKSFEEEVDAELERLLFEKEVDAELERLQNQKTKQASSFERIENIGRSALEGASLGISEPVISAVKSAPSFVSKYVEGLSSDDQSKSWEEGSLASAIKEASKAYDQDVQRRREIKSMHPIESGASELIGGIGSAVLSGGASSALGAGKLAKGLAAFESVQAVPSQIVSSGLRSVPLIEKALAAKGLGGAVARTGELALKGAATAPVIGGVQQEVEAASGFIKPEEKVSLGDMSKTGAAFGGVLGFLTNVTPEIAKNVSTKTLSFLSGAPESALKEYSDFALEARQARIEGKLNDSELKQVLHDRLTQIADEVDSTSDDFKKFKDLELRNIAENKEKLASDIDSLDKQRSIEINQNKFDEELKRQNLKLVERDLKSNAKYLAPSTEDIVYVENSIDGLKERLGRESAKSYEILDQETGVFDIGKVKSWLENAKDDYYIITKKGKTEKSDASKEALAVIDKYINRIDAIGDEITPSQAKKLIQGIDQDLASRDSKDFAAFKSEDYKALMNLRREIDSVLKVGPDGKPNAYAEQMKTVSALSGLMSDVQKKLSSKKIPKAIDELSKPNNKSMMALFESLDRESTVPVLDGLSDYINKKRVSFDSREFEKIKSSLPEYQDWISSKAKLDSSLAQDESKFLEMLSKKEQLDDLNKATTRMDIGDQLKSSPEYQRMIKAKEASDRVFNMKPEQAESLFKGFVGGRNDFKYPEVVEFISQLENPEFMRRMELFKKSAPFDKMYINGSRRVNMFGGLGLIYDLTTMVAGGVASVPYASAVMMGLGGVVDLYGPKMAREILEKTAEIQQDLPVLKKIGKYTGMMSDEASQKIVQDYIEALSLLSNNSTLDVSNKKEDWKNKVNESSMSPVDKAKALRSIRESGKISGESVKKTILGIENKNKQQEMPRGGR